MNRRQFLRGTSVLAGAALLAGSPGCRRRVRCSVRILSVPDYGRDPSKEIMEAMIADRLELRGKRVLLKPNFVEVHPGRPINTHPAVIAATAEACLRLGAGEVAVGEAAGHRRDPWYSVLHPSLRAVLDKRVRCLDLNHCRARAVPNAGGMTGFRNFQVAVPAAEADVLISLPKMKVHHWTGVTLSLKNLFGILPGIYYGWPKNPLHVMGIENSVLDIARTIPIHYAVIDGVVGMEGDGPIMGEPKPVGALILSRYALAGDATASRIMGFDPRRIPTLALASRFMPGLGESETVQRGEDPGGFMTRFACLPEFEDMRTGGRR
jgi:uncharacterized protein (DUF362 family)